jgi:hypothetical protein
VEKDVTVQDVSAANDWSEVKVWNNPTKELGTTVYPTYGFVYKGGDKAGTTANARNDAADPIAKILSGAESAQH